MLRLRKVAVTGGLSSGKSTVCRVFQELGAYVVSADSIVHQLLSPDTSLGQKVIKLLGRDIIANDQIDRAKIAQKVFNHPLLLRSLESLLHPAVRDEIEKKYENAAKAGKWPLFIAEIPLFFETDHKKSFDATIAVIADPEIAKQRFIQTTGYGIDEFEKRNARQLNNEEKAKRADFIIINNGTLEDMQASVKIIFNNLVKESNF
jgi:dephospho-CoA kinase